MGGYLGILFFWVVVGAILGAIVGPRQGWTPGVSAVIGGTFGLFGVLFLLIVSARSSPEAERLADDLDAYRAWQAGERPPPAAPASYVPCPQCATPVPVTARRCPHCGTDLSTCDECGGLIPLNEMTCRYCGTEYYDDEADQEPPAARQ